MSYQYRTEGDRAKSFAAEISRTKSTLHKLAGALEGLSDRNRRTLLDAAAILSAAGKEKKASAKKIKDAEIARERAFDKAEAEAGCILDTWPQSNLEDQIALCLAWRDPWNLEGEKDLCDQLKGFNLNGKHYPATRRSLLDVLSSFKRALQREAAYRASRKGYAVAEFLGTVREAMEAAKQSDKCRELVEAWRVALVKEQLIEANKGAAQ